MTVSATITPSRPLFTRVCSIFPRVAVLFNDLKRAPASISRDSATSFIPTAT